MTFHPGKDYIQRDILQRLFRSQHTISQLAKNYEMSFAAVANHLSILEKSKLIVKRRNGKEQFVRIAPDTLRNAAQYLTQFKALWNNRFDAPRNKIYAAMTQKDKLERWWIDRDDLKWHGRRHTANPRHAG